MKGKKKTLAEQKQNDGRIKASLDRDIMNSAITDPYELNQLTEGRGKAEGG